MPGNKVYTKTLQDEVSIKPDVWIEKMAHEHKMIEPFEAGQAREGIMSEALCVLPTDMIYVSADPAEIWP